MPTTKRVTVQEKVRELLRRAKFADEPLDALVDEIHKLYRGKTATKTTAKKS